MNSYALPIGFESWRLASPHIAGWATEPADLYSALVRAEPLLDPEPVWVVKQPTVNPDVLTHLTAAGVRTFFAGQGFPLLTDTTLRTHYDESRTVAFIEHPFLRIKGVWLALQRGFFAGAPHRLMDWRGLSFPAFLRKLLYADPLGVDVLLRPQWTFLTERTSLFPATQQGFAGFAKLFDLTSVKAINSYASSPELSVGKSASELLATLYACDLQRYAQTAALFDAQS